MQLVLIDNYDSFTYNLVQLLGECDIEPIVFLNDRVSLEELEELKPERIVISPGPGSPSEAGISNAVIERFGPRIPILGVCLGHQCIAHSFGGNVVRAQEPMHGRTSSIWHSQEGVFKNMPLPFEAMRYHSLIVRKENLPCTLTIRAQTREGEIMALQHQSYPIWGLQFHPESILTSYGRTLIQNFIEL